MEDAIRATIELTEAPIDQVKIRSSYNLAGISFDPATIGASIKNWTPEYDLDSMTEAMLSNLKTKLQRS
jgi:threonine 3-dehydrogenase